MQNSIIEMVTFKANANTTPEQLAATGPDMSAFLAEQSGFIYRSLSVDEDGTWHDIIYWETMADAKTAGENFMQHPAGQSMMALIDTQSIRMRHMPALAETLCDQQQAS